MNIFAQSAAAAQDSNRHLKGILLKHIPLIVFIVSAGVGASLLEGISLALVIPILGDAAGQVTSRIPAPFNQLCGLFSGLSLADRVRIVALLIVVVTAVKGILIFFNNAMANKLQIEIVKHFRMLCFNQFTKVSMSYINDQKSAHLQTIAVHYTLSLGRMFNAIGIVVPKFFTVVILLVMLMLLSWQLTLASLVLIGISSLVLRRIVRKASAASRKLTDADKGINSVVLDSLLGMKVVRLFNREKHMRDKFEEEVDRVNAHLYHVVKTHGSVQPVFEITGVVSLAFILILGSFMLLNGASGGLEIILTFIIIYFRILSPSLALNTARVQVATELPYYQQICHFLESFDKPYITNGSQDFHSLSQGIEFCGIRFRYNEQQSFVLNSVSFYLPKGKKIGIVGVSGSGKTTICELLLRFYDPQQGDILVDGADLKKFDFYSWRRHIGVVSQDVFLFNDTIGANIGFAKPDATKEDIKKAAQQAYADEFIEKLPQGYETIIGERGVRLSGGQRQRLAIARAVVVDPEIFIFDEATSALDTESEKYVQKAIETVGKGKTVITIAHRLSTVSDSDKIIVMDQGRIAEEGTHDQLLGKNGLYTKLVQMQNLEWEIKQQEKIIASTAE
ncbi:MAG TPA: ABC transporter ATP-binding protein [Candidatus Omnitrophota bacterium]|nr:ABC transporter ATP-binding protein [Candidatus Omnitrophota bacterium]HPD84109.1 ABC transporter ATP-binding protein [Candidatus Omnitrophota bacterium]HRZ02966.1 ABC transporter ATP-binding protein [Candidatus Omnitrophota bacterium]